MNNPTSTLSERPHPPAPQPRKSIPGSIAFFRALRGSAIEGFAVEHYEKPIVVTRTILGPVFVVSSPTALRHVLLSNAKNYPRVSLQRRILSDAFGFGLLAAEGEQWRRQRKVMAPHFTPEKVAAFEGDVAAAVADVIGQWSALGDGATVRLDLDIPAFAIDVLERTLFPDGLGEGKAEYFDALKAYFRTAGKLGVLDVLRLPERVPRIATLLSRKPIATLGAVVDQTLQRWHARSGEIPTRGILDRLAGTTEDGRPVLEAAEVRDNVGTLLSAGTETSAGAMCWALYLLSIDDEWRARVEEEADREMPDGVYVAGSQQRLVATKAVVEESLRLYPAVSVTVRNAIEADELDGVAVKPGTIVVVSPWLIHRHRTLWDNPDAFDPSRFLPRPRERIDRFSYLPFGTGPRICVGQGFSIQEMTIAIASISRRFRLKPAPDFNIWPSLSVSLQPSGKLAMTVQARD